MGTDRKYVGQHRVGVHLKGINATLRETPRWVVICDDCEYREEVVDKLFAQRRAIDHQRAGNLEVV